MQMFIKWCFYTGTNGDKKLCFEIIKLKYIKFVSLKATIEEKRKKELGLLVYNKKIMCQDGRYCHAKCMM